MSIYRFLLDRFGRSGLLLIALLLLLSVVAIFSAIPKMERDLQDRSRAKLHALGLDPSAASLRFEGRDAHVLLPPGSAVDDQLVSETLQQVRGVRRVYLEREEGIGEKVSEETLPAAVEMVSTPVTNETDSAKGFSDEKFGLASTGDPQEQLAATEEVPAPDSGEEPAAQLPAEDGSTSTAHPRPEADALEPELDGNTTLAGIASVAPKTVNMPVIAAGLNGVEGAADDASGGQASTVGDADTAHVQLSTIYAESERPRLNPADPNQSMASLSALSPSLEAEDIVEQDAGSQGKAVGESRQEQIDTSPVEVAPSVAAEEVTGTELAPEQAYENVSEPVETLSSPPESLDNLMEPGGEELAQGEAVEAQGEVTQLPAGPSGSKDVVQPTFGSGVLEQASPYIGLEFDPIGIRVSGIVADAQAAAQVEEALRTATNRAISFDLALGGAAGNMPWLPGVVQVVAGLQQADRGKMYVGERDGAGLWIESESAADIEVATARLKQRFMSAYEEDAKVAAAASEPGGQPVAAQNPSQGGDTPTNNTVAGAKDLARSPSEELNRLLGSNPLFGNGSYFVSREGMPALDRVADFFKANPGLSVGLTARSDQSVLFPFGMVIGLSRALAVRNYLLRKGIQPGNVLVGDPQPGVPLSGSRQIEFYQHRINF